MIVWLASILGGTACGDKPLTQWTTEICMSDQPRLPGLGDPPESKHRLFLAALPDAEAIAKLRDRTQILKTQHGLKGTSVIDERLHVSLIDLGDHPDLPSSLLEAIRRGVARVSSPAFDVVFDQAELFPRSGALFLKETVRGDGFSTLKKSLAASLKAEGARCRQSPTPHITLLYDRKAVSRQPVETVAWSVKEFVLVHSEIGNAARPYEILGRWPLQIV